MGPGDGACMGPGVGCVGPGGAAWTNCGYLCTVGLQAYWCGIFCRWPWGLTPLHGVQTAQRPQGQLAGGSVGSRGPRAGAVGPMGAMSGSPGLTRLRLSSLPNSGPSPLEVRGLPKVQAGGFPYSSAPEGQAPGPGPLDTPHQPSPASPPGCKLAMLQSRCLGRAVQVQGKGLGVTRRMPCPG